MHGIFFLVQCCVSGSGRIGIILPDPDPYSFQPNVKLDETFSIKLQDTVLSTILKIMIPNTIDADDKEKNK